MKKNKLIIATILVVLLILGISIGPIMSNVETPKYKIINSKNNIEIREYDPMIIAEVKVIGERKNSINEGFKILADYIFGNNSVHKDIAMTAPVQQQESTKIAMTAPVQQQSSGDGIWSVSFVMPSKYNVNSLPKPVNNKVTLKEIPSKKFIVITFSGTNSKENIEEQTQKLLSFAKENNIQLIGKAKYAFYNPPWTLPLLRRNEVMFELK